MSDAQRTMQEATPPTTLERAVGAAIAHSEKWGTVWFGLLFIGSVLGATAREIWSHANAVGVTLASMAIGLLAGIVAHVRGGWL
jgi:hypothetical protein